MLFLTRQTKGKIDLIDFFANRSERARTQDEKIKELRKSTEGLDSSLKRAQAIIESQKVVNPFIDHILPTSNHA